MEEWEAENVTYKVLTKVENLGPSLNAMLFSHIDVSPILCMSFSLLHDIYVIYFLYCLGILHGPAAAYLSTWSVIADQPSIPAKVFMININTYKIFLFWGQCLYAWYNLPINILSLLTKQVEVLVPEIECYALFFTN